MNRHDFEVRRRKNRLKMSARGKLNRRKIYINLLPCWIMYGMYEMFCELKGGIYSVFTFSSDVRFLVCFICVWGIKKGRGGGGPFDERYQRSNPRLADL